MEKGFKTIDEQIELLQSRNLHIENKETAKEILLNNNYYYLINGYKDLFLNRNSKTEMFRNKTTLEEIYSLYEFDRKIRIIFLEYVLLIERKIDTYIATYATRDLFSIIIILKILLEKDVFNEFYNSIIKTIKILDTQLSTIKIDKILYKMGFPKNYKELLKL